jgi:hypothetical protein
VRVERRPGVVVVVGGPVPPGADAITIGSVISVREGHEGSNYLLRHETQHVRQWHRYGFVGFLIRYLGSYALWRVRRKGHVGAYRRIPFEIEADWVARRNAGTGL